MRTFQESLNLTHKPTALIEEFLSQQPEHINLINVEKHQPHFKMGDLIWETTQGVKAVEVKIQTTHYTSLFLETRSNVERNTPGFMATSQADLFINYSTHSGSGIIIPFKALFNWLAQNLQKLPTRQARTRVGVEYYTSEGRIAPLEALALIPGARVFYKPLVEIPV